jgi:hypothetical protein
MKRIEGTKIMEIKIKIRVTEESISKDFWPGLPSWIADISQRFTDTLCFAIIGTQYKGLHMESYKVAQELIDFIYKKNRYLVKLVEKARAED